MTRVKGAAAMLCATSAENLPEVVALLRPDLCLLSRRDLDAVIVILVDARRAQGRRRKQLAPLTGDQGPGE